ncbi:MAG: hypothetical protein ABMA00_14405, partial [Gemmatimonas sp.]
MLTIATACGGGGTDTPTTPTPPAQTPAFSLALSANAPTVQQSGSGAFTVTITRSGGFTGAVDLTVEGAPALITPTLAPSTIPSGSTTSIITLAVSLNQPAGTYPMTIRARANGLSDQTATLSLAVVTRTPSITLTRSGTSALTTFAGGLAINATIIVNRIEYLGDVAFSVTSQLPAGLTATFAPANTTGNSAVVTFSAAGSTTPGAYNITLQGSGTGITAATLTLTFTVTPSASVSVGVSRNPVSIPQNGSGVTSVVLTRTNFTGAVTLSTSGAPAGVTIQFDNNPIGTNGTTMTFIVGPSTVPASYPITLTASAPGVASANVVVTLVVTATGTGGNTTLRFCGSAADIPIW